MNDYVNFLKDSINTSIELKIFKNREVASNAHIFKSKLVKLPLSTFKDVSNFNANRLQTSAVKAYPINDRPRGNDDINSVKYYQKHIQQNIDLPPIWLIKKNKYILTDGAHRVVASYIENKPYVTAYVIL